jgi:hypothetical protein
VVVHVEDQVLSHDSQSDQADVCFVHFAFPFKEMKINKSFYVFVLTR